MKCCSCCFDQSYDYILIEPLNIRFEETTSWLFASSLDSWGALKSMFCFLLLINEQLNPFRTLCTNSCTRTQSTSIDALFITFLFITARTLMSSRYFGSPQVAQIVFLRHKALNRRLAAVNTHVSCAWETPVKQLVQVQELMVQIEAVIPPDVPLVLGGDLNSLVGSGAYRLITEGSVSLSDPHAQVRVDVSMWMFRFLHSSVHMRGCSRCSCCL